MASTARPLAALCLALALVASACGGSDSASVLPDTTDQDASNQAGSDQGAASSDPAASGDDPVTSERFQVPEPPADGLYRVGDTYYDAYLSATHLGLAEVPVGPDIFQGGRCFTVLLRVDWYDATNDPGFGEQFRASTTGMLASGGEAASDNTGVGCDMTPIAAQGFERSIETMVSVGESKQVYLGALHVPDGETLESVSLYGSPDTRLDAVVEINAAG